jgi:hypothetical protein
LLTKPGRKSLHDFIEYECTDTKSFYNQLEQAEKSFKSGIDSAFDKILKALRTKYLSASAKTNVTEIERKEILDQFEKDYTKKLTEEWKKVNEQKMSEFNASIQVYLKSIKAANNSAYMPLFIEKIVMTWFTEKFKNIKPDLNTLSALENTEPRFKTAEVQAQNKKVETDVASSIADYVRPGKELDAIKTFFVSGQVKNFLDFIIECYVKEFFGSIKNINTKNKSINSINGASFVYEKDNEELGYYSPSDQKIYINLKYYKLSELLDFAMELFRFCNNKENNLKTVMKTKFYQDVFDETMKGSATAVLIHELEHARRDDATCQGAHTDGLDASGMKVNFNACARSWMQVAIENGFKDEWYEFIRKHAAGYAGDKFKEFLVDDSKLKDWNKFLEQFKELEKIKPDIAADLGF